MTRLRIVAGSVVLSAAITVLYALRAIQLFTTSIELWVRPLTVAVLVGILIGVSCGLLIRQATRAHLAASLFSAVAVSTLWAAAGILMVLAYLVARDLLGRRHWRTLTAADAIAGIRVFIVITVLLTGGQLLISRIAVPVHSESREVAGTPSSPNIYLILLDAYARRDTLAERYGTDISSFTRTLNSLGFDVYENSTSNYNATELTLLSMLTGKYADAIPSLWPTPADGASQARAIARALADASQLTTLREHGYEVVSIPPPVVHVRLYGADRTVDLPGLTDLEVFLYSNSNIGRVAGLAFPDVVLDDQRLRVIASLHAFAESATDPSKHFVLAHLMVPHPPFLWNADGSSRSTPQCFPGCNLWEGDTYRATEDFPDFAAAYAGQVDYMNRLVADTLRQAIEADPGGVFIVFGDHGSRLDKADQTEAFRNFFAARTPGHPDLFGSSPSLINTLPTIDRAYLGALIDNSVDRFFFVSDLRKLLYFTEVQHP